MLKSNFDIFIWRSDNMILLLQSMVWLQWLHVLDY